MELQAGSSVSFRERLSGWWTTLVEARWSLALALAIAAAPGHFLFPLIFDRRAALLDNSQMTARDRLWAVIFVVLSVALMSVAFLAFRRYRARRGGPESLSASLSAWNRVTLWILGLPLVAALTAPRIEVDRPWLAILFSGALATIVAIFVYRLPGISFPRLRGASVVAGLLILGYAALFSFLSVRQHWALGTHLFDLAIYDNLFWNTLHGRVLASTLVRSGTHLSAHFDPIIALLAPIYAISPRSETLLVLQSIWLALGAIPLYILARRKLGSPWLAVALVLVYLLYPALHGVNLYDFHSLALAGPLVLSATAALELGALRIYWVFVALALLVREDVSLLLCGVGLYAILVHRRKVTGLATIGVCLAYFAFVKLFVMLDPGIFMQESSKTYGYAYYFKDMMGKDGGSVGDLVASLVGNPIFVIKHLTTDVKLQFFFLLFLPLLFVPLLGGRRIVVMLYGFAFLFLSSRRPVFSIHFQYTTVLYPLAFALVPSVLAELREARWVKAAVARPARLVVALVCGMVVATTALSAKFGALLPNASFKAGFTPLVREFTDRQAETYRWLTRKMAEVPRDASVSATNRLAPHLSNRDRIYHFPNSADYVFVYQPDIKGKGQSQLEKLKQSGYVLDGAFRGIEVYRKKATEGDGA